MGSLWIMAIGVLLFVVLPRMAEDLRDTAGSGESDGPYPTFPPREPVVYDHPDLGEVVFDPEGPSPEVLAPFKDLRVPVRMIGVSAFVLDFVLLQHLCDRLGEFEQQGRELCLRRWPALAEQAGWAMAEGDQARFDACLTLEAMTALQGKGYELRFRAGDLFGERRVVVRGSGRDGPCEASLA